MSLEWQTRIPDSARTWAESITTPAVAVALRDCATLFPSRSYRDVAAGELLRDASPSLVSGFGRDAGWRSSRESGYHQVGGSGLRRIVGIIVSVLVIAGLAAGVYGCSLALQWLQRQEGLNAALDQRPEQPVAFSSLDRYSREVAGKAWFRRYFTTMVFSRDANDVEYHAPVVAKWERPRVAIKLLNDGGPGVEKYLRGLVRRLDRMQDEVRFVVGDDAPRITVRFLAHDEYVASQGQGTVGNTRTRYYKTSPGIISARITIDAGQPGATGQVKATLIHELTHAIGCNGHFSAPDDRRRSVLYASSSLVAWSQSDAAVIRVLYSPWVRTGMGAAEARRALRGYARSGG